MKKVLSFLFAFAAFAAVAADNYQYLYWMVDVSDQPEYAFAYATVLQDGSTALQLYDGETAVGTRLYADDDPPGLKAAEGGGVYSLVGTGDAYLGSSFLFELFSESGDLVAWKWVSGSSLSNYIAENMTEGAASAFTVSNVIPEPTSGLLFLLGVAALALRRREGRRA